MQTKYIDSQTDQQADRRIDIQSNKTNKQRDREEVGRLILWHEHGQTDRQTDRLTGRQAARGWVHASDSGRDLR